MEPVIGLDFGTTNSAIAVADSNHDETGCAKIGPRIALRFTWQGATGAGVDLFAALNLASHVSVEGSEDDGNPSAG